MGIIEQALVFSVTAFHLSIVPWGIGTDQLVANMELCSSSFKQGWDILLAVGKAIGKFKAIVSLHTFHLDTFAGKGVGDLSEEVSRGIGALLGISTQDTIAGILVNCRVLEKPFLLVCQAVSRYDLNVDLDPLSGVSHLLIRLWLGFLLFRLLFDQSFPTHTTVQTFHRAGIPSFPQPMPQLGKAKLGIPAAHISNELEFFLCVLVWVAVRSSGLAGKRFHCSVPATTPEIDVRAPFVVFPAGSADSILLCVFH